MIFQILPSASGGDVLNDNSVLAAMRLSKTTSASSSIIEIIPSKAATTASESATTAAMVTRARFRIISCNLYGYTFPTQIQSVHFMHCVFCITTVTKRDESESCLQVDVLDATEVPEETFDVALPDTVAQSSNKDTATVRHIVYSILCTVVVVT